MDFSVAIPEIEADDMRLRAPRLSDEMEIDQAATFWDLRTMVDFVPHPIAEGTTRDWLQSVISNARDEYAWVIEEQATGAFWGLMSFERTSRADAEIGYWIHPHFWRRGIATRALSLLLRANPLRLQSVFAYCEEGNHASAKVLRKAGFQEMGLGQVFSKEEGGLIVTREFFWSIDTAEKGG